MISNLKFEIHNLKTLKIFLVLIILIVLYFIFRLINLTILPVFADEAIYIRWSQVMRAEPTLRFLPLSDGKQPLFMWLTIPFLKIFSDPLFAGRLVSVLAGLGTMIGLFLLSLQIFKSKKISFVTAFLYAIVPFAVFFDRMALADSLLSMFGIWILYLSILLVQYRRLDLAMITGMVLGGALITKSPATFFVILIPFSIILNFQNIQKLIRNFLKMVPYWLVIYIFAFVIYNILRLGPNFQMIALRNQDYVFPLSNVLFHPFDPFQSHLIEIIQWFNNLLTWPVFLAGLIGIILIIFKNIKAGFLLLIWFLLPLLFEAEYAKVLTSRYLLFTVPVFLVFASAFIDWLINKLKTRRFISLFIILLFFLLPLRYDYLLLTDPQKADLPRNDRSGYLEGWTAGYGIKESADFFKKEALNKKILIGTEGYFGTLPDGLQMYLEKVPNITIIGIGLYLEKIPEQLTNSTSDNEVYLLINDERLKLNPKDFNLTLVASYPKAKRLDNTNQNLLLFMVK